MLRPMVQTWIEELLSEYPMPSITQLQDIIKNFEGDIHNQELWILGSKEQDDVSMFNENIKDDLQFIEWAKYTIQKIQYSESL